MSASRNLALIEDSIIATTGLLKSSASATLTAAVAGVDYVAPGGNITANLIGSVLDTNAASVITTTAATTPVNHIAVGNASTGNSVTISAVGTDTNVNLNLVTQGSGQVLVNGSAIGTGGSSNTLANTMALYQYFGAL